MQQNSHSDKARDQMIGKIFQGYTQIIKELRWRTTLQTKQRLEHNSNPNKTQHRKMEINERQENQQQTTCLHILQ